MIRCIVSEQEKQTYGYSDVKIRLKNLNIQNTSFKTDHFGALLWLLRAFPDVGTRDVPKHVGDWLTFGEHTRESR